MRNCVILLVVIKANMGASRPMPCVDEHHAVDGWECSQDTQLKALEIHSSKYSYVSMEHAKTTRKKLRNSGRSQTGEVGLS